MAMSGLLRQSWITRDLPIILGASSEPPSQHRSNTHSVGATNIPDTILPSQSEYCRISLYTGLLLENPARRVAAIISRAQIITLECIENYLPTSDQNQQARQGVDWS
jgi:hypothetical protein